MVDHIVTRERMIDLMASPNREHVIGKALVHLLNRQTREEQNRDDTIVHNLRGFTPADAYSGSLSARYYLKHKTLQDWQMTMWSKPNTKGIPRLAKYWRQLDEEAKLKANGTALNAR